jgi:hypothetical protein
VGSDARAANGVNYPDLRQVVYSNAGTDLLLWK